MIRAVVFDVGETLVDETEIWGSWADWLGVPRHTFSAVVGAMAVRGKGHWEAFRVFKPDFDVEVEDGRRALAGRGTRFGPEDLYPDVRPCVEALREMGVWVGIAGNQPVRAERDLLDCGLPVQMIATSAGWGVKKPEPAFFERIVAECPYQAHEIVYVGDRVVNDVVPARAAGLATALIRRGVWGFVPDAFDPERLADVRLRGLDELPRWVAERRRA
ncbi:HAD family hydrolase [Streptomyces sp. NPDC058691]|uniref:HAD family hydrolase n=1 Tax=Streptomyces sp. NPDC058691 TaxID=3346601 RepID=UPI00365ECC73